MRPQDVDLLIARDTRAQRRVSRAIDLYNKVVRQDTDLPSHSQHSVSPAISGIVDEW